MLHLLEENGLDRNSLQIYFEYVADPSYKSFMGQSFRIPLSWVTVAKWGWTVAEEEINQFIQNIGSNFIKVLG